MKGKENNSEYHDEGESKGSKKKIDGHRQRKKQIHVRAYGLQCPKGEPYEILKKKVSKT